MGSANEELTGPDLKVGVEIGEIAEDGGMLLGHADGEAVLLVRRKLEVFAIGAKCTHYGGPLAEGRLEGNEVRCPWHHACFDIRTGEASAAPALNPVACWSVVRDGGKVRVSGKQDAKKPAAPAGAPASVVVLGAGAAGEAAVEMLRREGYAGAITMVGHESSVPVDRPNLSKDYLAGTAPEEWIPLRPESFFAEQNVTLKLGVTVSAIDTKAKRLTLEGGETLEYGALIFATGAEPIRLGIPGADRANVFTLRSLADSRAIIAKAEKGKRAVVIGASFIGLEVAASLRAREVEVDIVAPEAIPLARVMGDELGRFIQKLHEDKGVRFHLGKKPLSVDESGVKLDDGKTLAADLVVMGVGVRPRTALAEAAGITVDNGVVVDAFLQTSAPGVWAAGDAARFTGLGGEALRVEHWVVAQRLGQVAAKNVLGKKEKVAFAPFFWSNHYDVAMGYVGHATKWDKVEKKGSLDDRSCIFGFREGKKIRAVVAIGRDTDCLAAEAAMERGDDAALDALFA